MNVSAVENGSSTTDYVTEVASNELDKNAFLLLLVTQMQYQTPWTRQTNEEFVAQLAQFSALEQMENLNTSFQNQAQFESLTGAARFIGLSADAVDPQTGDIISGEVAGVEMWGGVPYLVINDTLVGMGDITNVYQAQETIT